MHFPTHPLVSLALALTLLTHPSTATAAAGKQKPKYKSYTHLRCPLTSTATLPTPTYGKRNAAFTVCTEQLLHASLQEVYDALLDFQKYEVWNSFVVDVKLPANVTDTPDDVYENMPMTFTTQGLTPADTISQEKVTQLSPPSHQKKTGVIWAVWGNDDPAGTIQAEHPSILSDAGGGYTRYLSYETYYKGAELVAPLRDVLNRQFVQQGVDLADYVEGRVG